VFPAKEASFTSDECAWQELRYRKMHFFVFVEMNTLDSI
jgi:hypothetical protein